MSTVVLTITDRPNDPSMVDIKWDVSEDEGTGAAKALAKHLIEHIQAIRDQSQVTDVEPKP